ncbi:hypothetical protein FOE74_04395 [Rufibacter glacialis]|nr:hypothetical protein FOE74_04395 [Rufibacter glacialis]
MRRLMLKSLYVVALLKYPSMRDDLRYFVRDNYFCRINQFKFLFKDYLQKKKYKVTNYQGEFDQELRYVLPFAYWHFLNGTLAKTISSKDTKELYFFSENHEERYEKRIWTETYNYYDVPNMTHSASFNFKKWAPVPYKAHYANSVFKYDKPVLVIANKYNIEWDQPPINFFDIPTLDKILTRYKNKYQIIYNRPLSSQIVLDNSEVLDLKEHAWIKEKHPEVILMNDLYDQHLGTTVNNYNHLQLMVYANADRFLSIHGGTAILACCFGGTNIILSNPKWGMEAIFNEYATIMPKLSGAKVIHARNRQEVLQYVYENY